MKFEKQSFTALTSFFEALKEGRTFCNNMNDNDEPFGMSYKKECNFSYTHVVAIDIDNSTIEPSVFYAQSSIRPTYLYTSFSHSPKQGKIKYHVLYIVDEKIKSKAQYELVYDAICTAIRKDFPTIELDNSMRSVAQCTNGTSSSLPDFEEYYDSNNVTTYSLSALISTTSNDCQVQYITPDSARCPIRNSITPPNYIISSSGQYMTDLFNMNITDFLQKYSDIYEYREQSEANFNEHHYEVLGDYNAEIWVPYKIVTIEKQQRRIRCKFPRGKGKRFKALVHHGLDFRVIFPSMTYEHLVYCLLRDLYNNFDNTDGKYGPYRICEIASLCMKYDMTIYVPWHQHKYHVDKQWCRSQGIPPKAYAQHIRKIRMDEAIGELYDTSLSVRENTKVLNEYGLRVSKSRVGQFKKEHNL